MTARRCLIPAAAVSAISLLSACSSTPPPVAAHGTVTLYTGLLSGSSVAEAYPDVTAGSQVTVTNTSGTVIGTGTLSYDKTEEFELVTLAAAKMGSNAGVTAAALSSDVAVYEFTVTVPSGLSRYGISVGTGRGTIYENAAEMKDPALTLGSLSG